MSIRNKLHLNYKEDFKKFLTEKGFEILETKGYYEEIRAKKDKRIVIIYKKMNAREHLSVMEKDNYLLKEYFSKARVIR